MKAAGRRHGDGSTPEARAELGALLRRLERLEREPLYAELLEAGGRRREADDAGNRYRRQTPTPWRQDRQSVETDGLGASRRGVRSSISRRRSFAK